MSILRRTFYNAGPFSFKQDGSPISPYDLSTYNIAEFMGVKLHECTEPIEGSFDDLTSIRYPRGNVQDSSIGYILDCKLNDSYAAINRLLRKGIEVHRIKNPILIKDQIVPKGSFFIPEKKGVSKELIRLSKRLHLNFFSAPNASFRSEPIKTLKIGVYQRYWGGNIDEGWTRWVLEKFRFRYRKILDSDFNKGRLNKKFDVIIFPSDHKSLILGEGIEEYVKKRWGGTFSLPEYPKEYRSGIGKEGVKNLEAFVEKGGNLVTLGEASNFAIEELKLPVKNVLKGLKPKEFLCPGSTLHVNVNKSNPLSYGMPSNILIIFRNHPAFEVTPGPDNEKMEIVLSYPDYRIMESGWLIGEERLSRKAALIDGKKGNGRVILFGFSPQFRAQSDATFKLFFNCLLN
jgi:hypothetical protein